MKSSDIVLNTQSVGTSPGTTTVALGDAAPATQELVDPYGSDSRLSGAGLGDDTPDLITGTILDPNAWGPGGDVAPMPPIRWPLIMMTAMTVFAGVLGYGVYARKKHQHGVLGDGSGVPRAQHTPWGADQADNVDAAAAARKASVDRKLRSWDERQAKLRAKAQKAGAFDRVREFTPESEEPDVNSDGEINYAKKPAKDDGDCLKLGNPGNWGKLKFGRYEVCLTENQKKTLFKGKIGKKLGCGKFACAYTTGRDKVVKFTRDPEDVAAIMAAQPTGVAPKLYNVYEIMQGGRNAKDQGTTVYAMTLERLKPMHPAERSAFDSHFSEIHDVANDKLSPEEACDTNGYGDECSQAFLDAVEITRKLKSVGIDWTDSHSGNVGYDKKGKLKALDIGMSNTRLETEPDVLDGVKLAKIRKQLGLAKL